MILKLEIMANETKLARFDPPRFVWLDSAKIHFWYANGERTTICTEGNGRWHVTLGPDELAAVIDPENACPEPGRCGYQEYLAYRQEGQTDLGHGAYHAAVKLAESHGQACRVYESGRVCPSCAKHEQRLRA